MSVCVCVGGDVCVGGCGESMSVCVGVGGGGEVMTGRGLCRRVNVEGGGVAVKG